MFKESNSLIPSRDSILRPIENELYDFYDQFFNLSRKATSGFENQLKYPKYDLFTLKDEVILNLACPGIDLEDISVKVFNYNNHNIVKIRGKISNEYNQKDANYTIKELSKSSFERLIYFPTNVENIEPEATLEKGILTLKWKLKVKKTTTEKEVKVTVK